MSVGLVAAATLVAVVAMSRGVRAVDSCQQLAICALDHCIPPPKGFPPERKMITELLESVNFGCVLGPACYEHCQKCESCVYAQDQVKRLLLHEKTVGRCPSLEKCARSCLDDHVADPFNCVFKSRCAHHCIDKEDCAPCRDVVKRVFTGFCFRHGFIEHYGKKCKKMFDDLAADLVAQRGGR